MPRKSGCFWVIIVRIRGNRTNEHGITKTREEKIYDSVTLAGYDIIGKEPVKDYYITFKSKCIKSKKYEPLDKQLVNPNLINIIDKIMNKSKKLESIDFCIILLDDKSNILYKLVKYY